MGASPYASKLDPENPHKGPLPMNDAETKEWMANYERSPLGIKARRAANHHGEHTQTTQATAWSSRMSPEAQSLAAEEHKHDRQMGRHAW